MSCAVIKNADMSEETQRASVECAPQALEKYDREKDIAALTFVFIFYSISLCPTLFLKIHSFSK
uniref:Dynein light chain n=1 Tax=Rhinolophus ferrumequinum TaxID=59479 RepID=A0A671FQ41_RHIFE